MKILLVFTLFIMTSSFAKNITLFEDLIIDLPRDASIKEKSISELPNNSLQSLLNFEDELEIYLSNEVSLFIGLSDIAETSNQMNSLSTLNWLTVVSKYANMIQKNVIKEQEQGYKTASTLTGDWVGKYRAIISRLGWATEKGLNNLFIADIFHEKAMLAIKVTWTTDKSEAEKIADQVISSIKMKIEN